MINFISYNKGNEKMIIYQCEYLFDMITREERGEIIIHRRSGRDITKLVRGWIDDIMPIKWDIEAFESELMSKQFPIKPF